ncbi:MAG: tRNA nucleotidyltransferase [Intestinimonas sp.]|jgi:tRNA nucleotidyltransferase (CCA-adding enzyme)|nr:tRNA nucleotidyltransferase [Intestinimonas sp.]
MIDILPQAVQACCDTLRAAGYAAFPVGGCVRDLLLGRTPGDWDITTAAPPEAVMARFSRTVPTGIRHGTVTVLLDGMALEVTTFRRETGYADGRHPDHVIFIPSLEGDLARRDFTINAMALGADGQIIDPFGGQGDLATRRIRAVGEPALRFREDGLRILRAARFAAQLDFIIEPDTAAAMRALADRLEAVSGERICAELEKLITAPHPERGGPLVPDGLPERLFPTGKSAGSVPLARLALLEPDGLCRWAGLAALTGLSPTRLPMEKRVVRAVELGLTLPPLDGELVCLHALRACGVDACRAATAAWDARTGTKKHSTALRAALCSGMPWKLADLDLTGRDLLRAGLRGPEIGAALSALLDHVVEHPEDNRRTHLLTLVTQQRKIWTNRA